MAGRSGLYSLDVLDLHHNGYDNTGNIRQSYTSYLRFTTDATSIIVTGTTTAYNTFSYAAKLGVRVDGIEQASLSFIAQGQRNFKVTLGNAGDEKTVEIISGALAKETAVSTGMGTFIDAVDFGTDHYCMIRQDPAAEKGVIYGDSVASGFITDSAPVDGWPAVLRYVHGWPIMTEAWGWRSLYDDASTTDARAAFVARMASYNPTVYYFAIGGNDFTHAHWSPANFGTAYAAVLDEIHALRPNAKFICQTMTIRFTETGGLGGATLDDYRAQIASICTARSPWAVVADGESMLTLSDLSDGVHPTTAGHEKYAAAVHAILTSEWP